MSKNLKWITLTGVAVLVGALLVALATGTVWAQRSNPWSPQNGSDWGYGSGGMLGDAGRGSMMDGMGYGPASATGQEPDPSNPRDGFDGDDCHSDDMMGDWGAGGMMGDMGSGMMGGMGPGMMDDWDYEYPGDGTRLTLDQAAEAVEGYLTAYGNPDLAVAEVMEFTDNFYAQVEEQSTGIHAFELLVNPYTGLVYPEHGPNMMWNTEYGHMGGMMGGMMGGYGDQTPTGEMAVSPEEAVQAAQAYLDRVQSGLAADDHADVFYGYYTLHTLQDGQVEGMLSVNGASGQVWYHNWHGDFIGMAEGHEE